MPYRDVDPTTAHALTLEDHVYIDVRTVQEFDQGHPAGAWNIPAFEAGPFGMQPNPSFVEAVKANFPEGTKLVLGCAMGGRSARACELLAGHGFPQLVNVAGGWNAWVALGLPTSFEPEGRGWSDLAG